MDHVNEVGSCFLCSIIMLGNFFILHKNFVETPNGFIITNQFCLYLGGYTKAFMHYNFVTCWSLEKR